MGQDWTLPEQLDLYSGSSWSRSPRPSDSCEFNYQVVFQAVDKMSSAICYLNLDQTLQNKLDAIVESISILIGRIISTKNIPFVHECPKIRTQRGTIGRVNNTAQYLLTLDGHDYKIVIDFDFKQLH